MHVWFVYLNVLLLKLHLLIHFQVQPLHSESPQFMCVVVYVCVYLWVLLCREEESS